MKQRLLHVLIAFDQLVWVLVTLGRGYPDETISAAAWRLERQGKLLGRIMRSLIDALFWPLERDHCRRVFENELRRYHLPSSYRDGG